MLNWSGDDRVRNTGKGSGSVVLTVGKVAVLTTRAVCVVVLELAFGEAEGAELDGNASADTDQWSQSSLVES